MSDYEIVKSSPLMAAGVAREGKYPWHSLNIGDSFKIPVANIKYTTLMTLAYRTGKRLNKKFKVVLHPEMGIYEVGRLADPVGGKAAKPEVAKTNEEILASITTPAYRGVPLTLDNPKPVGDGSTAPVGWPLPGEKE